MQYTIIAKDYKDEDAINRRLKVREDHITLGKKLKSEGNALYAAALLDEEENMNGSVYIVDFSSKKELDDWLRIEPYMVGRVWEKVEIIPCKVSASYL